MLIVDYEYNENKLEVEEHQQESKVDSKGKQKLDRDEFLNSIH